MSDVSVQVTLERAAVVRVRDRIVGIDLLERQRLEQRLVEELHAQILSGLDLVRDLVRLVGLDELRDGARHDERFANRLAAALVARLHQDLRDDGEQRLRQEALRLFALFDGQRVDDAIDRLGGGGGVQRAEHEMAGFRGGHRHRDRLRVAQLAHEDDVGIFAHRRAHAFGERRDVRPELALDDLRELAAVDELDRIFERDDVESSRGVEVIDHRRERRRLAGAGRAGHEHHALMVIAELLDDRRQRELVEARDVGRDRAERRADAGLLAEDVDAKPAAIGRHIGEVEVVALVEELGLVLGEDFSQVTLELRVADVAELDGHQVAIHAQHGRNADGQVHVGAVLLHAELQERVDASHGGAIL